MTGAREPKQSQAGYILGGRPECSGWTLKSENEEEKKHIRNLELPYTVANLVNRLDLSICAPTPRRKSIVTRYMHMPQKAIIWRFVGMHRECKISHVNYINTYLCFAFTILDSIWHWQERERQMKEPEMCILSTILDEVQHPQYMSNNLSIRAWWLVLLPVSGFMAAMQSCPDNPLPTNGIDILATLLQVLFEGITLQARERFRPQIEGDGSQSKQRVWRRFPVVIMKNQNVDE
ncbi:hypothetical protein EV359DRAFT_65633 [Lentinula novae-zelandiae]|nr:hypothetical protein EV359DRAFT_65633 [Lentinula novae-zelandiae]